MPPNRIDGDRLGGDRPNRLVGDGVPVGNAANEVTVADPRIAIAYGIYDPRHRGGPFVLGIGTFTTDPAHYPVIASDWTAPATGGVMEEYGVQPHVLGENVAGCDHGMVTVDDVVKGGHLNGMYAQRYHRDFGDFFYTEVGDPESVGDFDTYNYGYLPLISKFLGTGGMGTHVLRSGWSWYPLGGWAIISATVSSHPALIHASKASIQSVMTAFTDPLLGTPGPALVTFGSDYWMFATLVATIGGTYPADYPANSLPQALGGFGSTDLLASAAASCEPFTLTIEPPAKTDGDNGWVIAEGIFDPSVDATYYIENIVEVGAEEMVWDDSLVSTAAVTADELEQLAGPPDYNPDRKLVLHVYGWSPMGGANVVGVGVAIEFTVAAGTATATGRWAMIGPYFTTPGTSYPPFGPGPNATVASGTISGTTGNVSLEDVDYYGRYDSPIGLDLDLTLVGKATSLDGFDVDIWGYMTGAFRKGIWFKGEYGGDVFDSDVNLPGSAVLCALHYGDIDNPPYVPAAGCIAAVKLCFKFTYKVYHGVTLIDSGVAAVVFDVTTLPTPGPGVYEADWNGFHLTIATVNVVGGLPVVALKVDGLLWNGTSQEYWPFEVLSCSPFSAQLTSVQSDEGVVGGDATRLEIGPDTATGAPPATLRGIVLDADCTLYAPVTPDLLCGFFLDLTVKCYLNTTGSYYGHVLFTRTSGPPSVSSSTYTASLVLTGGYLAGTEIDLTLIVGADGVGTIEATGAGCALPVRPVAVVSWAPLRVRIGPPGTVPPPGIGFGDIDYAGVLVPSDDAVADIVEVASEADCGPGGDGPQPPGQLCLYLANIRVTDPTDGTTTEDTGPVTVTLTETSSGSGMWTGTTSVTLHPPFGSPTDYNLDATLDSTDEWTLTLDFGAMVFFGGSIAEIVVPHPGPVGTPVFSLYPGGSVPYALGGTIFSVSTLYEC